MSDLLKLGKAVSSDRAPGYKARPLQRDWLLFFNPRKHNAPKYDYFCGWKSCGKDVTDRDFPSDPLVKTLNFYSNGMSLIPGWGTKTLQCILAKKNKTHKPLVEGSGEGFGVRGWWGWIKSPNNSSMLQFLCPETKANEHCLMGQVEGSNAKTST